MLVLCEVDMRIVHIDNDKLATFVVLDLAVVNGSFADRRHFMVDLSSEQEGIGVFTAFRTIHTESFSKSSFVHLVQSQIVSAFQVDRLR